jgi:hypothetical protein
VGVVREGEQAVHVSGFFERELIVWHDSGLILVLKPMTALASWADSPLGRHHV